MVAYVGAIRSIGASQVVFEGYTFVKRNVHQIYLAVKLVLHKLFYEDIP